MTEAATPDFNRLGLLHGLRGRERDDRLELLGRLQAMGVSVDELTRAAADGRLAILPVERALFQEPRYTAREAAEQAGTATDVLLRQRAALGLPAVGLDDRVLTEEDVAAAANAQRFLDAGLDPEALVEVTRVMGAGMARLSDAVRGLVRESLVHPGDSEQEVALRLGAVTVALLPVALPLLEYGLRVHLREQLRHEVIDRADLRAGGVRGTHDVTVAFADVVDFTGLGRELTSEGLGAIGLRLGAAAQEAVRPPARLVKTIGDAVMFVSSDAVALVETCIDLVERFGDHDGMPAIRAGVAAGPAVNRFGDWYGSTVNLASRVTTAARAQSVLVTEAVVSACGDRYRWSRAGGKQLKGFPQRVELLRARRQDAAAS